MFFRVYLLIKTDAFTTGYTQSLNYKTYVVADSVLTGDVTLTIASEFNKIVPNTDSTVVVDENGYVTGINKNTTVDDFVAMLQNEAETITITDVNGNELTGEALVGTGAVVTLKSKYTDAVYETKTIIIYGDLDGDGDVDDDDFSFAKVASVAVGSFYTDDKEAFFLANDVNGDGCIDVLDSWVIGKIVRGWTTVI